MGFRPCLITTNHRVSRKVWEKAFGPIPPPLEVLHQCDNPLCRELTHLYLGTQADNVRDMDSKGRRVNAAPKREKHGRSKLTWAVVRAIRARWPTMPGRVKDPVTGQFRDTGLKAFAASLGVSTTLLSQVIKGTIWREE